MAGAVSPGPQPTREDTLPRQPAVDVGTSFIVQAPAGSGKTELLIQRLLALLARAEHPEEVVAITFTRKAAAEMKNRLLGALAQAKEAPMPAPDHEALTWRLARAVLARDQAQGWHLELEPQQLRIDTVDALNGWLARRLPLAAGAVAGLDLVDDARHLYRLAARRTVAALDGDDALAQALQTLLGVLDARLSHLETLLAELAPHRDQWLRHIRPGAAAGPLRARLESALQRLVDDHWDDLADQFPAEHLRVALQLKERFSGTQEADAAVDWPGLAELLLTGRGTWRRRLSARDGFPAADTEGKQRMKDLLAELEPLDELRDALAAVRRLPTPRYDDAQWRNLEALRRVLPHLAAELRVIFQEAETCDFVEIAIAAGRALGATEAPSDLLLALDRRIQHILVDEFQDTSHTQLHLLETLTAGWQPGDGRTLFLVGDPMQSIYRFRDADMSLFLRVRAGGIGSVALKPLTLHRNFRSDPQLVAWVNTCFARCMPAQDDMGRGAAAYVAAQAARAAGGEATVAAHLLPAGEPAAEATCVTELLQAALAGGKAGSIAVLVQSRSHLTGLQHHLSRAGITAQAVDIDAAHQHQVVQDLLGLTRALLHPLDRIAWLGVLRMPCCGVTLKDLARLCEAEHALPVYSLLRDARVVGALSHDGQARIGALLDALETAFAERGAHGLSTWVERTWLRLGAAELLDDNERFLARRFFAKLTGLTRQGDLDDPADLETAFREPEPMPITQTQAQVQIMTVHRAKGLEFDTVVFMGLGREWPQEDAKALRWLERTNAAGGEDLLLAPLKDRAADEALHEFIRREARDRDDLERVRPAYVATTRARNRLHLVAQMPDNQREPAGRNLLSRLWPAFAAATPDSPAPAVALKPLASRLRRVRDVPSPAAVRGMPEPHAAAPPTFEWVGQAAVHVGTVAHGWLQRIAEEGAAAWTADRIGRLAPRVQAELRLAGVDRSELPRACERVLTALKSSLADPTGRWILDGGHTDAHAELALTVCTEAGLERLVLDRTFVADGQRWIVDYKTSVHEGGAVEAFLDNEVERYRPQLERYARALAPLETRPIRVGLYFPLLTAWRHWAPDLGATETV
jgi:ATP-dependent exoDNAse (exonuclease V) beta subunit